MYGAYAAGVLKGWSASGRRPQFDVVTGIGTGALIGVFAFLGPDYDIVLEQGYTGQTASDLISFRYSPLVFWSDSLAHSHPLRHRVRTGITPKAPERWPGPTPKAGGRTPAPPTWARSGWSSGTWGPSPPAPSPGN